MGFFVRDECVGCPPNMGCLGSGCPNRNIKIMTCDFCDNTEEDETIYHDVENDEDICESCLGRRYKAYE